MVNKTVLPEYLINGDDPDAVRFMHNYHFLNDKLYVGTAFPTTGTSEGYAFPVHGGICIRMDYDPIRMYIFKADDTGTATSGGTNYLIDTSKSWSDDEWNGYLIAIVGGTGKGQVRTVTDTFNATQKVEIDVDWTTQPDNTSIYQIYKTDDAHWSLYTGGGGAGAIPNVHTVGEANAEYTTIAGGIGAQTSPAEGNQGIVIIYPKDGGYAENVSCVSWVHLFFYGGAYIKNTNDSGGVLTLASNVNIWNLKAENTSTNNSSAGIVESGAISNVNLLGQTEITAQQDHVKQANNWTDVFVENIVTKGQKRSQAIYFNATSSKVDFQRVKIIFGTLSAGAKGLLAGGSGAGTVHINHFSFDHTDTHNYDVEAINDTDSMNLFVDNVYIYMNVTGSGTLIGVYKGDIAGYTYIFNGYISVTSSAGTDNAVKKFGSTGTLYVGRSVFLDYAEIDGAINFGGNQIRIGDGKDSDIYIYAHNGDANKPNLRYNKTTNAWEYSNDGTIWSAIGSGGGGLQNIELKMDNALIPTTSYPDGDKDVGGTNSREQNFLDFSSIGDKAHWKAFIPSGYTSQSATIYLVVYTPDDTSGEEFRFSCNTHYAGDGEVWDGAGTTDNGADVTVKGTATHLNISSISLTVTGWGALDELYITLTRIALTGGTDAGSVKLLRAVIVFS